MKGGAAADAQIADHRATMMQAANCTAETRQGFELPKARKYGTGTRTRQSSSGLTQISTIRPPDESGKSAEVNTRDVARSAVHKVRTTQAFYGVASSRTYHGLGLSRVPNTKCGTAIQSSTSSRYVATASPSDESVQIEDIVEWFKEDRSPFKVSHLHKKGKPFSTNFWERSGHEKQHKVGDSSQVLAKSEKLKTGEQRASNPEICREELVKIEDRHFLALTKRNLHRLEAEIELCCQDNASLHGRVREEMEGVIKKVLQTIKHGGNMDVNEAIEYNDQLLNMQQKFEDFGCSLQKAKADLASVKTICAQLRCRCWWCKGCSALRNSKLIRMHRNFPKLGNKYQRPRKTSSPL